MSVTFIPTDPHGRHVGRVETRETACLCAQLAPSWEIDAPEHTRAELASYALDGCHFCGGTGVEVEQTCSLFLNMTNTNARALLALLGLARDPDRRPFSLAGVFDPEAPISDDLSGSIELPEARRAIMLARATFARRAGDLVRPAVLVEAPARVVHEGGLARIVPGAQAYVGGLDETDLAERLEAFASLLEAGAAEGAVAISWG